MSNQNAKTGLWAMVAAVVTALTATGAEAQTALPGSLAGQQGKLSGVYICAAFGAMGIQPRFLLFLPEGRVSDWIPDDGLETFSWEKARATHPKNCGRWELTNGRLTLSFPDQKTVSETLT